MTVELLPLFEWCEGTALGQLVRTSIWLFPVIESIHLLGLASFGGAVLLVDLRLLGLALPDQPIATLARGAQRWLTWSLWLMLGTGVLLFVSEAVKCYHNPSFWVKILTMPFALAFTYLVRQRIATRESTVTGLQSRLIALASIVLWFTVSMAGRWIGYSS